MNERAIQRALEGKRSWLTRSSVISGSAGAVLASIYGVITLTFPEGTIPVFAMLVAGVLVAANGVAEYLAHRKLRTLRQLGAGKERVTEESVTQAAREISAIPDFLFKNNLVNWAVGVAAVAFGLRFVSAVPWSLVGRLLLLGVLFGPLSSLLAYVLTLIRTRKLIGDLNEAGVTSSQLITALPERAQLMQRLLAFIAISVIATFVMAADVSSTLSERGLEHVASLQDGAAQLAAANDMASDVLQQVLLLSLFVFALAIITAYFAGNAIAEPIRRVAKVADRIAKGELGKLELVPAEDEIWALSAAFSKMHGSLAEALEKLKLAGIRIGSTTEQIVATSSHYESGATQQATALNETSATTEELARSARQIAENAGSVSEIAARTLNAAQTGRTSAEEFSRAMARVRQDNQAISDSVVKLARRVQQIGKVVSFINGVADRSDLLALNAELEGTKAGEVGRGFALVAGEMRRLAENVIESTREIEEIIDEIRDATQAAVTATEGGVQATEKGTGLAGDVSKSLESILELAERTSGSVRAISLATQQQQTGTDQLAEAMTDILRVTQQSLASTKQVTSANSALAMLSRELKAAVDRFHLEERS
ncbi:MAG: methyl-accepting chemotaxis protein [Myxococcaceae bacterium]